MSRTIDERVVKMEFDNKRFESNVKESLSTIDKLKKSMDFDSAKAFSGIDKAANKVSFSGLLNGIDTVRARFSMLDVASYTVMSRLTNGLIDFGKKIVTAIPSQIKEGGVSRALNIEQAKFQLEGLHVAWDKIKGDIEYGVKDTAYGLDEAAKAASQLVASGVNVGQEMKDVLKGISGVAAMTNSSYSEISHIFTTAAGQGKVMTIQLRELENRGLNAAATLAKSMGTSEAAVRDMVTKGEIDFKTFSKAMTEAFGDHATAANKTFTGALANMKAALSRIGQSFATPIFGHLRDIFNELRNTFNNIHKALGPVIMVFERFAATIKNRIVGSLKDFNNWFENLGGKNKVIIAINYALTGLLQRLVPIKKAFEAAFPKTAAGGIDNIAESVIRFTKSLLPSEAELNALYYIFRGIFAAVKLVGNALKVIVGIVAKLGPVLAPLTTLITLFGVFGFAIGKVVMKLKTVGTVILSILPLLKVLGIVAAAALGVFAGITVIRTIITNFDKIKSAFQTLGNTISTWFQNLKAQSPMLQKIADFFGGLGGKLKKVGLAIAQFAKMAYNAFSQNGFIGGFKKLGEQLRATVNGVNQVKKRSVEMADTYNLAAKRTSKMVSVTIGEEETTFQKFARIILTVGDKIKQFFANLKKVLTIENIKQGFKNTGEVLHNTFTRIGEALKNSGIAEKLKELGSGFVSFAKNLNYGKIAAIGFATALITLIFRISSMFSGIGTLTREAGLFLGSLRKSIFNFTLIKQTKSASKSLLELAISIGLIAGSIIALMVAMGKDPNSLIKAAGALAILGASLITVAFIATKLGALKQFSLAILGIAGGVAILTGALLMMNGIDFTALLDKMIALGGIVLALAAAMAIVNKVEKSSVTNIIFAIVFAASIAILIKNLVKAFQAMQSMDGKQILAMAGGLAIAIGAMAALSLAMSRVKNFGSTLAILAFAIFLGQFGKALNQVLEVLTPSKLDEYMGVLDKYKEIVLELGVLATVMLGVASLAGEGIQKLGTGLLAMAAAVAIIAFVVTKITEWVSTLSSDKIGALIGAIAIVGVLITFCGLFNKLSTRVVPLGKKVEKASLGATFLAMGASLILIAQALKMIAGIESQQGLDNALGVFITFGIILALLVSLSNLTEKANVKAILAMTLAISTITLSLMLLTLHPWQDLLMPLAALGGCMAALAGLFVAVGKLKPNKNAFKTLIPVVIMLGVLGAELIILSNMSFPKIIAASAGMSGMIITLGLLIRAISKSKGLGNPKTYENKIKMLIMITIMLGILGTELYLLSGQDFGKIIAASAGMAGCMVALGLLLNIISKMSNPKDVTNRLKTLGMVAVLLVALGGSLALAGMHNWKQVAAAGASMAACMLSLSVVIKIINGCKPKPEMAKQLLVLAGIMVGIGAAIAILSHYDWEKMLAAALIMSGVIWELVGISKIIQKTKVNIKMVKELAALAGILIEIAVPLVALSHFDIAQMALDAALMSALIWELVGISYAMDKINPSILDTASLALAAGSLVAIAIAMAIVGKTITDPGGMIAAAGALSIAIGAIALSLGLLTNFTNAADVIASAAAIVIMAGACVALSYAIKSMNDVDWDSLLKMGAAIGTIVAIVVGLGVVLGILVDVLGIGALIQIAMFSIAGAFAIFSAGVLMLGLAMTAAGYGIKLGAEGLEILIPILDKLKDMPVKEMATALIELSKGLGALALAGIGLILGAVGFAAFGLALQTGFVPGLLSLAELSATQLEPLAANIRMLVDALKPIQELGIALIPAGIAFTLFGAALALAGYGINQGAQGLNILGPALQQLAPLLTEEFIQQMGTLALGLMAIGSAGIVLGFGAIGLNMGGAGLTAIANGLVAMQSVSNAADLSTTMATLSEGLTKIGGAGFALGFGAMGLILGSTGLMLLSIAVNMFKDVDVSALGTQLEELSTAATSFAVAGIKLMVGAPGVIAASVAIMLLGNAMTNFSTKFETALNTVDTVISKASQTALSTAKKNYQLVGRWIPLSIINGMLKGQPGLIKTGAAMASALEESIRNVLGIHSLSEILAGIGEWICKSLGIGIQRKADGTIDIMGTVAEAIKGKCAEIVNSVSTALGIGDVFTSKSNNVLSTAGAMDEKFGRVTDSSGGLMDAVKELTDPIMNDFKESFDDLVPSMDDVVGGLGDVGNAAGKTKTSFESLRDTIEQQMDIFSEFNDKTEITGEQMLNNMRSQVQGVAQWAANLQMLAARGIDQGLLAKLSELGPQGYEKVAAFVQMTDAQLQEANQLYATSLMLPSSAAAQITGSFAMAGRNATQGFLNGWDSSQISMAMLTGAQDALTALTGPEGLDENSPSKKTEEAGRYAMLGLQNGLDHNSFMPINSMRSIAQKVLRACRETLTHSAFQTIGLNCMKGLENGLDSGSGSVVDKMHQIADSIIAEIQRVTREGSPSKVFYEIGRFLDIGLMNGISENGRYPVKSMGDVANAVIYKTAAMAATISDIIEENLDAQPTITPILDLTQLQNGVGIANSLMASRSINLSASQAKLQSSGQTTKATVAGNTVYEFTQNNYSPKALDRSEIYRQTRNQFSQIKQARV